MPRSPATVPPDQRECFLHLFVRAIEEFPPVREVSRDTHAICTCRVTGVLEQFPYPANPQNRPIVLDPVQVLENGLGRVIYEDLVSRVS